MDSKPPNSRALLRHLHMLLISNSNCHLGSAAVYPPRTSVNPLEDSIRWLKGVPWPHYSFKSLRSSELESLHCHRWMGGLSEDTRHRIKK